MAVMTKTKIKNLENYVSSVRSTLGEKDSQYESILSNDKLMYKISKGKDLTQTITKDSDLEGLVTHLKENGYYAQKVDYRPGALVISLSALISSGYYAIKDVIGALWVPQAVPIVITLLMTASIGVGVYSVYAEKKQLNK